MSEIVFWLAAPRVTMYHLSSGSEWSASRRTCQAKWRLSGLGDRRPGWGEWASGGENGHRPSPVRLPRGVCPVNSRPSGSGLIPGRRNQIAGGLGLCQPVKSNARASCRFSVKQPQGASNAKVTQTPQDQRERRNPGDPLHALRLLGHASSLRSSGEGRANSSSAVPSLRTPDADQRGGPVQIVP